MRAQLLSLFCARFNQTSKTKEFAFSFSYKPLIFKFLFCLERNRMIQTYRCEVPPSCTNFYNYFVFQDSSQLTDTNDLFLLKIYPLYYSGVPLFRHLLHKSTKKQLFTFSCIDITKFINFTKNLLSPALILQTSLGIISHNEAAKKAIGGLLICIMIFYW